MKLTFRTLDFSFWERGTWIGMNEAERLRERERDDEGRKMFEERLDYTRCITMLVILGRRFPSLKKKDELESF